MALADDRLLLTGGITSLCDVWESRDVGFSFTQLAVLGCQTLLRDGCGPRGRIFVAGGYPYVNDVWRSSDDGETWVVQTTSPGWAPPYGAGMAVT